MADGVSFRHGEGDSQSWIHGLRRQEQRSRTRGPGWAPSARWSARCQGLVLSDFQAVQVLLGQVVAEPVLLLEQEQILTTVNFHINCIRQHLLQNICLCVSVYQLENKFCSWPFLICTSTWSHSAEIPSEPFPVDFSHRNTNRPHFSCDRSRKQPLQAALENHRRRLRRNRGRNREPSCC